MRIYLHQTRMKIKIVSDLFFLFLNVFLSPKLRVEFMSHEAISYYLPFFPAIMKITL